MEAGSLKILLSRSYINEKIIGTGRLGVGTVSRKCLCERNPWLRTVIKINVTAISGKHYSHQSNFYFRQHHFHPEKIYIQRFVCIDSASISVKEGLYSSKQHTLKNNTLHPILGRIQLPVQLDHGCFIKPTSIGTLSKRPSTQRPVSPIGLCYMYQYVTVLLCCGIHMFSLDSIN